MKQYTEEAVNLLCRLIETPRVSRDEKDAADIMEQWMAERGLEPMRVGNNIVAVAPGYDPQQETVMLNAHIDTVRPVASWTRDPHKPEIAGDRLYGIGSNDCGGGLVTLLQVFRILRESGMERGFNLVYIASAEEEVSGREGISSVIPLLPQLIPGFNMPIVRGKAEQGRQDNGHGGCPAHGDDRFSEGAEAAMSAGKDSGATLRTPGPGIAIVGEPTGMQPAVAEKGLMVIDMTSHGVSGHAARNEGVNAIYEALDDMVWIRSHKFEKVSDFLGETRMTLTVINSGTQHNVVPDECKMVIDIRTNELYTNEEVFDIIRQNVRSEVKARSFRLSSSSIPLSHPVVKRCMAMGMTPFGSPTLSDQALMPWPSLKLGPGQSSRSHSADEFICISELEDAIEKYLRILSR